MAQKGEEKKKHKFNPASNKKDKLNFISQSTEQKNFTVGQSNMMDQSAASSLNVSTMTANNTYTNARPSTSMGQSMGGVNGPQRQSQFIANPPALVRALVQAKVGEIMFKRRCEELTA